MKEFLTESDVYFLESLLVDKIIENSAFISSSDFGDTVDSFYQAENCRCLSILQYLVKLKESRPCSATK